MAALLVGDLEVIESPPPIFTYASPEIQIQSTTLKHSKSMPSFTPNPKHRLQKHHHESKSSPKSSLSHSDSTENVLSDMEISENLDAVHSPRLDHHDEKEEEEHIEYLVISDIEDMHSGYDSNDTMDSHHTLRGEHSQISCVDFIDEEALSLQSSHSAKRKKRSHGGMRYVVGIGAVCAIGMWIGYGATRSIAILSSVTGSKKK